MPPPTNSEQSHGGGCRFRFTVLCSILLHAHRRSLFVSLLQMALSLGDWVWYETPKDSFLPVQCKKQTVEGWILATAAGEV